MNLADIDWATLLPAVLAFFAAVVNFISQRSARLMGELFKGHIQTNKDAIRDVAEQMGQLHESTATQVAERQGKTIDTMSGMHREAIREIRKFGIELIREAKRQDAVIDVAD